MAETDSPPLIKSDEGQLQHRTGSVRKGSVSAAPGFASEEDAAVLGR